MDKVFFEQLKLPKVKYNLDVGSATHGKQTGEMLVGIEKVLQQESPDVVLVQGDTNTVLAVAAVKMQIKVGHVEADLRSYERWMPEEINRILADHCSDYLFAPTENSKKNLVHEGIEDKKVFVVGNTVVDAVNQNLKIAESENKIFNLLGVKSGKYLLATSHRQENVDDEKRFGGIIRGLQLVQNEFDLPLIYPIHPRAKKQLESLDLDTTDITFVEPLDYLAFLKLESKAKLVLTDSGGVQEETCILGIPCVTLRESTERPETLDVGSNILAGTNPERILESTRAIVASKRSWINPFGNGKTSQKIIDVLKDSFA
jgi:UDP-N-acetylglucosamine 2-epimerase (non-hydrolysing)